MGSWYWRRKACQRDSAFASVNLFGPKRARRSAASALVRPLSGSTPSSRTAPSSERTCQTGASVVGVEAVTSVLAIQSPLGRPGGSRGASATGPGEGVLALRHERLDLPGGVLEPRVETGGVRDVADDLHHRLRARRGGVGLGLELSQPGARLVHLRLR